jgi:hypothetical protein
MEDSVPKSMIRKWLNDIIEQTEDDEAKLRALDQLSKLEQYTGAGMKKDPKKIGVFIVQNSQFVKGGPGKKLEDAGPPA